MLEYAAAEESTMKELASFENVNKRNETTQKHAS